LPPYVIGAVLRAEDVRVRRQRRVVLRLLVQEHEHADAGHEQHARRGDADGLVEIHHLVLLIFDALDV
jgi:Fe2+ or Zn2+ uptake regulation protein